MIHKCAEIVKIFSRIPEDEMWRNAVESQYHDFSSIASDRPACGTRQPEIGVSLLEELDNRVERLFDSLLGGWNCKIRGGGSLERRCDPRKLGYFTAPGSAIKSLGITFLANVKRTVKEDFHVASRFENTANRFSYTL